jgi:hypothetical protein
MQLGRRRRIMNKLKLTEARKRVAEMDKLDRKLFGEVEEYSNLKTLVRTCKLALEAGITNKDWSPVEDAYVMLERADFI